MSHDDLRIQAAKMGFLRRVAGISLSDMVRSSVTREGLGVEPLLLCLGIDPFQVVEEPGKRILSQSSLSWVFKN